MNRIVSKLTPYLNKIPEKTGKIVGIVTVKGSNVVGSVAKPFFSSFIEVTGIKGYAKSIIAVGVVCFGIKEYIGYTRHKVYEAIKK